MSGGRASRVSGVSLRQTLFGDAGRRASVAVVALLLTYVGLTLLYGVPLLLSAAREGQTLIAIVIALTIAVSVITPLQMVQFVVLTSIAAFRLFSGKSVALVAPPPMVPDRQLPMVTVQIPGRNEPCYVVKRSIDSALALDYPKDKLEIQYLDNSDAGAWDDIRAYCDTVGVKVLHREGVSGFKAGNLNMGLREARGELIGLLDVGDTFSEQSVRLMACEFVADSRIGFVQASQRINNARESVIAKCEACIVNAGQMYVFGLWSHLGLAPLGGHGALVRTFALRMVGGWDETRISEDWVAGFEMGLRGWKGKWVDYTVTGEAAPTTLDRLQKQRRKWATGATELLRHKLIDYWKSDLPWHHKLDVLIRLSSYSFGIVRYLGMQLLPLWMGLYVLTTTSVATVAYGIAVTVFHQIFLGVVVFYMMAYLARRRHWEVLELLLYAPIWIVYNVPIVPHIARGVANGLRRRMNVFTITPKGRVERSSWSMLLARQRTSLLAGGTAGVIAAVLMLCGTEHTSAIAVPFALFCALTLLGIAVPTGLDAIRQAVFKRVTISNDPASFSDTTSCS